MNLVESSDFNSDKERLKKFVINCLVFLLYTVVRDIIGKITFLKVLTQAKVWFIYLNLLYSNQ